MLQGFRGGLDSPYVKVETSTKMVSTSTTAGHEYEHSTAQRSTARVNKGRRTGRIVHGRRRWMIGKRAGTHHGKEDYDLTPGDSTIDTMVSLHACAVLVLVLVLGLKG